MANNQNVNKVIYDGVTLIDVTDTTATESDVVTGKVFTKADGSKGTGTANYMDLVSNPTANDILVTDANGQAIDSGESLSDLVHVTGDTMTGRLTFTGNATSKPIMTKGINGRADDGTDGPLYINRGSNSVVYFGNTSAHTISADGGTYTGKSANVTGVVGASNGGTGQTTLKASASALAYALTANTSTTFGDDVYIVACGNTTPEVFYRRKVTTLQNYINNKLINTSAITTATTMTASSVAITSYDNHGTLEKFGRVCTLDLNCTFTNKNTSEVTIGTLPTGYRPRVKHSYNIPTNNGFAEGMVYIAVNTNGSVVLGPTTSAGVAIRGVLTWITTA